MNSLILTLVLFSANAAETPAECPDGTHRELRDDPYQPFECVKTETRSDFGVIAGPRGFKENPRCPRGTRAVLSEGLQKHRCVRAARGDAEPELAPMTGFQKASALEPGGDEKCPPGKIWMRTNDVLRPHQCVAKAGLKRVPGAEAYRRYTVPAEMSFEYPRALQPRDGWTEEVPTLSFTHDSGLPGKPVTITITKVAPSQPTYIDIEGAAAKDKEWQGAKDGHFVPAGGRQARVTIVPGESKTAYIPLSAGAYYAVVYSAPAESYNLYLGAFDRVLKTMTLTRRTQ